MGLMFREVSQNVPNVLENAGERTLDPTKPGDAAILPSHCPCKFRFDTIFLDPTCFDDPGRPK